MPSIPGEIEGTINEGCLSHRFQRGGVSNDNNMGSSPGSASLGSRERRLPHLL